MCVTCGLRWPDGACDGPRRAASVLWAVSDGAAYTRTVEGSLTPAAAGANGLGVTEDRVEAVKGAAMGITAC